MSAYFSDILVFMGDLNKWWCIHPGGIQPGIHSDEPVHIMWPAASLQQIPETSSTTRLESPLCLVKAILAKAAEDVRRQIRVSGETSFRYVRVCACKVFIQNCMQIDKLCWVWHMHAAQWDLGSMDQHYNCSTKVAKAACMAGEAAAAAAAAAVVSAVEEAATVSRLAGEVEEAVNTAGEVAMTSMTVAVVVQLLAQGAMVSRMAWHSHRGYNYAYQGSSQRRSHSSCSHFYPVGSPKLHSHPSFSHAGLSGGGALSKAQDNGRAVETYDSSSFLFSSSTSSGSEDEGVRDAVQHNNGVQRMYAVLRIPEVRKLRLLYIYYGICIWLKLMN